jgi:hypothetical protein
MYVILQKTLSPPIPTELALSFYLQGWKLIFAVYHIINDKGVSKFNRYQAECAVPWINEVLLLLTVGLQTVQQLKDKVTFNRSFVTYLISNNSTKKIPGQRVHSIPRY